jgi:hypothetical protein
MGCCSFRACCWQTKPAMDPLLRSPNWPRSFAWLALACVTLACKPSTRTSAIPAAGVDSGLRVSPTPTISMASPPRSWITELREQARGEPMFLYKKKQGGIAARTIGGTLARDLVAAAPREAMFDPAVDLLWIRGDDRLDVIDLREAAPTVVAVASGLPTLAPIEITMTGQGGEGDYTVERPSSCDVGARIELKWATPPELFVTSEEMNTPTLVGRPWLVANIHREKRPASRLVEFLTAEEPQRVRLPKTLARCDDPDDCGMGLQFGATGWVLVLVHATGGGDCQHSSCLLYDRRTKTFASPRAPTNWRPPGKIAPTSCGPFRFDAAGSNYLSKSAVCSPRNGCTELDGEAIDWIDRGAWVGVP